MNLYRHYVNLPNFMAVVVFGLVSNQIYRAEPALAFGIEEQTIVSQASTLNECLELCKDQAEAGRKRCIVAANLSMLQCSTDLTNCLNACGYPQVLCYPNCNLLAFNCGKGAVKLLDVCDKGVDFAAQACVRGCNQR